MSRKDIQIMATVSVPEDNDDCTELGRNDGCRFCNAQQHTCLLFDKELEYGESTRKCDECIQAPLAEGEAKP